MTEWIVCRKTREDGKLVTLGDLMKMERAGQLENPGHPFICRITEDHTDENPMFIYHTEVGNYVRLADSQEFKQWSKELENIIMWGNKEGYVKP